MEVKAGVKKRTIPQASKAIVLCEAHYFHERSELTSFSILY